MSQENKNNEVLDETPETTNEKTGFKDYLNGTLTLLGKIFKTLAYAFAAFGIIGTAYSYFTFPSIMEEARQLLLFENIRFFVLGFAALFLLSKLFSKLAGEPKNSGTSNP